MSQGRNKCCEPQIMPSCRRSGNKQDMQIKCCSFAIGLSAIGMISVAQSARAETALAGTSWNGDLSNCHIDSVEFWKDGTARLTFHDQGTEDMDDGTWNLNGVNVTIGYVDPLPQNNLSRFADESLAGTYSNGNLVLAHSWKNWDGTAQSETCTFVIETPASQPKSHQRSRHKPALG